MKKRLSAGLITMGLGILTTFISGCTTNRINLVDTGVVNLEQRNTGKVCIAWSGAYEQGDGFVITGVLVRRDHIGMPIRTHVDITVLSPDGTVLDEARSSDVYVSRRITGRSGHRFERFKVYFPNIPAKGSLVRVVNHSGRHDDKTNL